MGLAIVVGSLAGVLADDPDFVEGMVYRCPMRVDHAQGGG